MNMKTTDTETENQSDFDTASAVAEISADLFGQGGESEDGAGEEAGAGAKGSPEGASSVDESSPQQTDKTQQDGSSPVADPAASPENSEAVQEVGAPKTWTKEALEGWAAIPPRQQQEILKREEDFMRGISAYKGDAEVGQKYSKVVEPYAPILAAEGIDPVQMFQSFAANHYLLSKGTEAQKLELAASMIQGYGIDFGKLISHIGEASINPVDPEVAALRAEINELKSSVTSRQQQESTEVVQRLEKEIETFAADPANPFFEEVADDIALLFKTGQASNLKEAYDKAIYLNPVTRQKEIDRLTAERSTTVTAAEQARQAKIAKASATDLSLDPKARNGTVPVGSIDDTLAETMARIAGRA